MNINRLEAMVELFSQDVFEHLVEHGDFSATEKDMQEHINKVLCKSIETAYARFDEHLCLTRPETLKVKDRITRTVLTLAGPVVLERRRYHDTRCDASLFLCDRVLGLPPSDKLSPRLAQMVCRLAVKSAYQDAVDLVETLSGHAVSKATVKSTLQSAADLLKAQSGEHTFGGDRKIDELYCESDGIHVALQQRSLPPKDRRKRSKEVHMSVVYEGKEVAGGDGARRINRHVCATTEGSDELWNMTERHIDATYDTTRIGRSYLGIDGARWCFAGQQVLPGRVIIGYDAWHVFSIIRSAAKKDVAGEIIAILLGRGAREAAGCAREYAEFYDSQGVEHRLGWLSGWLTRCEAIIENGLAHNLGTMEGTNAHVIGARLKNYGGAWSVAGIEAMVALRAELASGGEIPLVRATLRQEAADEETVEQTRDEDSIPYRSLYNNTVEYYRQAKIAWENESCRIKHNMAQVY